MRIAGIMSGTSLDGIDVAVIDTKGPKWELVEFTTTPYPKALKARILAVSNCTTHTSAISRLNFELGERYAAAVLALRTPVKSIQLIGCHGQTIFHERGNTLQIGEPAVIAERTGIPVVSNFRTRDVAAGGQGAPLVPFVDYLLFRHKKLQRVALNIGGIANITILPPACTPADVLAFDTGPGNMVIDQFAKLAHCVRRHAECWRDDFRSLHCARQGAAEQRVSLKLLGANQAIPQCLNLLAPEIG